MNWYFADERNQQITVTEDELVQLVRTGTIRGETLVWNEQMTDWRPCREVRPDLIGSLVAMPPTLPVQYRAQPTEPVNGLSIASLVLGIFGLLGLSCYGFGFPFSVAAVICGHIARNQMRLTEQRNGEGMAIAGLITGYISIGLVAVGLLVVLAIFLTIGFAAATVDPAVTPEAVP